MNRSGESSTPSSNGWAVKLATLDPRLIHDAYGSAPKMPISINRPEDPARIQSLEAKAVEYKERIAYVSPDAPNFFTNYSKLVVLQRVLDEGVVRSGQMMDELYGHPTFEMFDAEEAIRIVNDYCETGGQNNHAGTGLPDANVGPAV